MSEIELEEYKQQLIEYLDRQVGESDRKALMKTYEGIWQDYAQDGWEVKVLGISIIHGL